MCGSLYAKDVIIEKNCDTKDEYGNELKAA